MTRKEVYRVHIYNEDATTIEFVAKSKLDASFKYADWLKENGQRYGANETTDFTIDFLFYVYE